MIAATNPLPEKLALFWHDHFATSLQKVKVAGAHVPAEPAVPGHGSRSLRAARTGGGQGRGDDGVARLQLEPARQPQRELRPRAVRALHPGRGELLRGRRQGGGPGVHRVAGEPAHAAVRLRTTTPRRRAQGCSSARRGSFGGEDVVRLATTRPACARFITAKVWSHFARPAAPDDPIVAELTEAFAPELDMRALLRAIFLHPEFDSPATRAGLVKQPIEYVAGASARPRSTGRKHRAARVRCACWARSRSCRRASAVGRPTATGSRPRRASAACGSRRPRRVTPT